MGSWFSRHALIWLVAAVIVTAGLCGSAVAQTITQYPVPSKYSEPDGITVGPDGALWFIEYIPDKIGRITTSGTFTEFTNPTQTNPLLITSGPDGALWFTEPNNNKIGRITTSGAITEYALPHPGSSPEGITAGPDGALWFTEAGFAEGGAAAIGRITTSGSITEFATPTTGSGPAAITVGPDGALWFTESSSNKIGRVTTSGSFTEYSIPTAGSTPIDIAAGPDGALWFVEYKGNQVGRVTVSGAFTEYPIPTSNSIPLSITSGPDGALWFTESAGNKIGRITTAGAITEYANPNPSPLGSPDHIVTGPNNALWFTDGGNDNGDPGYISTFATATLTVTEAGTGSGNVTSNVPLNNPINCSASSNQCSVEFLTGQAVTLSASASAGSSFAGWSGGGCSGTGSCTVTLSAATTVTATFTADPQSVELSIALPGTGGGTVTSNPSGINCGTTCNASFTAGTQITLTAAAGNNSTFAGWSGGGCGGTGTCVVTLNANTVVDATFTSTGSPGVLVASDLPESRSVEVGNTATAFATIINVAPNTATNCTVAPATTVPASFLFQTTDPTTNAVTGTPNTGASIASGGFQTYVFAFTPTAPISPTQITLTYACANASPAPIYPQVNTFTLVSASTPVPDTIAIVGSADPGYVDVSPTANTGDFVVAIANVGVDATITAAVNTGTANLPITTTICQTNAQTGACLAAPAANVTLDVPGNSTASFAIFVTASAVIPEIDPINRAYVTFTDASGTLRGQTSVAIRTH
jgi:virginiamycin B lyase